MATTGRDSGDPAAPSPMLTVAAVARRLGVAPSTLRTWDRRYDLGPSAHTAGSHRRYGPQDLARLVVMRRLTMEGVPPAEAARIALASPSDAPPSGQLVPPHELGPPSHPDVAGAALDPGPVRSADDTRDDTGDGVAEGGEPPVGPGPAA